MNKKDFLEQLRNGLRGLPEQDVKERLSFYSELIDDSMEEGLSESEAVSQIGTVEEIIAQVLTDTPLTKILKERVKPKRQMKAWEIVLLILGSPIWLSLLIAAFAVILALYIVLWSVIIALWAIWASLVGCGLGGIISAIVFITQGYLPSGFAMLGAGFVCAGLSVFVFFGCKAATRGILLLTKKIAVGIKNYFIKKEEA